MGGGLLQLSIYGTEDMYITGNPNITYMKKTYKRYTNFGLETIASDTKSVNFGSNVDFLLGNAGDLLHKIVLEVKIPSISDSTNRYAWCKYLGHALIENVSIDIDGNKYDEYSGEYIHSYTRINESKDKINEYDEMIGNREELNMYSLSKDESIIRIPLLFWFCNDIGLSLPILKIQEKKVKISVKFRDIGDVLSVYNGSIYDTYSGSINPMNVRLLLNYVYLDNSERSNFIQYSSTYLITQVQMLNYIPFKHNIVDVSVDLNHPVKEILWFLRLDKQLKNGYLDYFNFTVNTNTRTFVGNNYIESLESSDLIAKSVQFYINGIQRTPEYDSRYYQYIEPYYYHDNIPKDGLMLYSFSLYPQNYQPSGTCNMTLVDSFLMKLKLNVNEEGRVQIFGINYNVIEFTEGNIVLK